MNIVICDDERKVIQDVGEICRSYFGNEIYIYGFYNAESLLRKIAEINDVIDLFILDIEMPGKDGLWLKQELERYHYGSSILYLTSHDELVHEAFGRYVIGFVDKVKFYKQPDLLIEKLKIFKQSEEQKETIGIKDELGSFCIYKDQIVKITSEHVYSYLEYTTGRMEKGRLITEKQLIRKTLKDWEKELGDNFLRPSKQMIINMDYIQRFDKIIILKDGTELSIPRTNYGKCHDRYFDYCGKKMKWR